MSNHEVMIPSHHHTSQSGPAGPAGPAGPSTITNITLSEQLGRAVSSSNTAVSSSQELSERDNPPFERVQTAPDGAVCMRGMTTPLSFPSLSLLSPWKAGLTPSLLPSCFMEGDCLVEACVLASTREQWSVAGVAMVFGWKADGMLTLTGGTYSHFVDEVRVWVKGSPSRMRLPSIGSFFSVSGAS